MNKLVLISILFLFGCKTKEIAWDYECNLRYPIKEKIIKGETVYSTDTLIEPGLIINCDPIILKAKCPDSKIITKTINRVDTVVKENTAKISLLERTNNELVEVSKKCIKNASDSLILSQKYIKQRNWLVLIAFGLLIFAFRKNILNLMKLFI